MFDAQEKSKVSVHSRLWKCRVCGKNFRSEIFIDRHFDSRHADIISKVEYNDFYAELLIYICFSLFRALLFALPIFVTSSVVVKK